MGASISAAAGDQPGYSLRRGAIGPSLASAGVPTSGANALARKLARIGSLSGPDHLALAQMYARPVEVRSGSAILREGEAQRGVCVLLDGWACRYKRLAGGRRQIFAILLPGDLCDARGLVQADADHGVSALTSVLIARTPIETMSVVMRDHPRIAEAVRQAALLEQKALRAWLLNLGVRKARERVAHLFCELSYRTGEIGLWLENGAFRLPLTQQEIGESLGLTSVHVNRVLQGLRAEGLLDFSNGVLHIPDVEYLRRISGFDQRYLKS